MQYDGQQRGSMNDLMEYLVSEIRRTQSERAPLEQRWIEYQRIYRAQPATAKKDFPWPGAANLVVPTVATDVDIVVAKLMGTLFGPPNLWSVTALRPDMTDFAPRAEEFLAWAQDAELGAYSAVYDWLQDIVKLGTGVMKQRYVRQQRRVYEWREGPQGVTEQQTTRLVKDSPVLQRVSLPDFFVPACSTDLDKAVWCAERLKLGWGALEERGRAGIYQNVQRLSSWNARANSSFNRYDRAMQDRDGFTPSYSTEFEIFEFWLDWDMGAGEPEAILATIHLDSRTFLRVDRNPFFNQEKPYSVSRYVRQEGRFYGIGLCEMGDQFQDAASTMTNQRIDNATIMNMTIFKARDDAGIKENEPFWPGRVKLVKNMEDLEPMNVGQKADTTIENEALLMGYKDKRIGVNDWISGDSGGSTNYAAATTAVQMLKEGSRRFDQVLRDVRRGLAESGVRILELYQQFNQGGKPYLVLGDKDGAYMDQILHFPTEIVRSAVFVDVTSANGAQNKEVEIRTNQIVFGLIMQFYQQLMQGVAFMLNPQVPEPMRMLAQQMVHGGTKLMHRILDAYGIQDADDIIPDLEKAIGGANQTLGTIQGTGPGGPPVPQGPPQSQGFPALPPGPIGVGGQGFAGPAQGYRDPSAMESPGSSQRF